VPANPVDANERTSDTRERIGIIVCLDDFEGVERGIAREESDELGETKVVAPHLDVVVEGCSGQFDSPSFREKAGGDSR
jgi:hypothetical protein